MNALGLAEPEQPVVDEDARELIAHGTVHQRRRHRGVDAAGKRADHLAVADAAADVLHRLVDEVARGPVRLQSRHVEDEVADDLLALRRVDDLRVELQADEAVVVAHHGDR